MIDYLICRNPIIAAHACTLHAGKRQFGNPLTFFLSQAVWKDLHQNAQCWAHVGVCFQTCSPHLRLPHLRLTYVLLTYVLRMFSSLTSSSRKSILANAKHLWAGVVKGFLFKTALLSPWENSLAEVRTQLVSWCFEPSQPQRITSGLNTNFKLSPSHSFHKSLYQMSFFFSPSQTTAQILPTISERRTSYLFSCCFQPSQPLGITSGLNTNANVSLSYSAHKSFNINHNILSS